MIEKAGAWILSASALPILPGEPETPGGCSSLPRLGEVARLPPLCKAAAAG